MGSIQSRAPNSQLDFSLHDLPMSITYDKLIGSSKCMKTLKCFGDEGPVLVKVLFRDRTSAQIAEREQAIIAEAQNELVAIRDAKMYNPNVMPFQVFHITPKAAYSMRQYFKHNLYDRLSTRPFLVEIEKLWLTFQVMIALDRCHQCGISHGDLKLENVLLTSWDWVLLSDFAPYKPTFLPSANNGQFDYFFDSSGHRKCYLAPERFYDGENPPVIDKDELKVQKIKMDVFSLGCLLAELWLEKSLFSYSELLQFRNEKFDPFPILEKGITHAPIREMISQMLVRDRTQRKESFTHWLKDDRIFPPYFEFLHRYIAHIQRLSPDEIIQIVHQDLEKLMLKFVHNAPEPGVRESVEKSKEETPTEETPSESAETNPKANETADPSAQSPEVTPLADANACTAENPQPPLDQFENFEDKRKEVLRLARHTMMSIKTQLLAEEDSLPQSLLDSFPAKGLKSTLSSILPPPTNNINNTNASLNPVNPSMAPPTLSHSNPGNVYSPIKKQSSKVFVSPLSPKYKVFEWLVLWSVDDVVKWLGTAGFSEFIALAKEHAIDGSALVGIESLETLNQVFKFDSKQHSLRSSNASIPNSPLSASGASTSPLKSSQATPSVLLSSGVPFSLSQSKSRTECRRVELLYAIKYLKAPPTEQNVDTSKGEKSGFYIIVSLLCAMIRNINQMETKLLCLECFDIIAPYVGVECRLFRIVPYLVDILKNTADETPVVVSGTLKTLTRVLSLVKQVPKSDANLFPEYLLPILSGLLGDDTPQFVRLTLAQCLPSLATTSRIVLESFLIATDAANSLRRQLESLRNLFKDLVVHLLAITSPVSVKSGVLSDITTLCVFFGEETTNDFILPLIISCLNDRDDPLKCVFLKNIVGVSRVAGPESIDSFILPCILSQIYDDNELIVKQAIIAVCMLCEINVLKRSKLLLIVQKLTCLLLHPNVWIRLSVVRLLSSIGKNMSLVDSHCFVIPVIQPFLTRKVINIADEEMILLSLRPSLKRTPFLRALDVCSELLPRDRLMETKDITKAESRFVPSSSLFDSKSDYPTVLEKLKAESPQFAQLIVEMNIAEDQELPLLLLRDYIENASRRYKKKDPSTIPADALAVMSGDFHSNEKDILSFLLQSIDIRLTKEEQMQNNKEAKYIYEKVPVISWILQNNRNVNEEEQINFTPPSHLNPRIPQGALDPNISYKKQFPFRNDEYQIKKPITKFGYKNFITNLIPPPLPDLGECKKTIITDPNYQITWSKWRPEGLLMGHLQEHDGPLTGLEVCDDYSFFASSGHDGVIKIWDPLQLNMISQSVVSYAPQLGPIKSLAVCKRTHGVACAFDRTNAIHVMRVDVMARNQEGPDFTCALVKTIDSSHGSIISLQHATVGPAQSLLLYSTTDGYLHGWDIRSNKEAWRLKNQSHMGVIQSFTTDPTQLNWLVLGSNLGYITGWDIRFGIPFREWRVPSKSPIYDIVPNHSWGLGNNTNGSGLSGNSHSILCACGPGDFQSWDLESGRCTQVFMTAGKHSTEEVSIQPLPPDEDLCCDVNTTSDTKVRKLLSPKGSDFILAAGIVPLLSYWDVSNIQNSFCFPSDNNNRVFTSYQCRDLFVAKKIEQAKKISTLEKTGFKDPSLGHRRIVSHLNYLELPQKLLLSGSRDGVIKVWR